MTEPTTPTVALSSIHDHPANPRINAVADDEMVESIRHQGILDPLMVAPRPDGDWDLIDGHRRKHGATLAGLDEVPINPRYDLVTDVQKIEVMVVTGLQKALLTPVEEAAGYEQLDLLGMDVVAIAAATGFGVRRIRERMKLTTLPPEVRTKVHNGEASLVDVAALEEFKDQPEALAEVEEALGTENFQQTVFTVRSRLERQARKDALIAEFIAAGAVKAQRVPGSPGEISLADGEGGNLRVAFYLERRSDDLAEPAAHAGCLAYVDPDYVYSDPYLICFDRTNHPEVQAVAPVAPVTSDWEKQQAARDELAARRRAASAARRVWLTEHLAGLLPARTHGPLATAVRGFLPSLLVDNRDVPDAEVLLASLGALPDTRDYEALTAARASYAHDLAHKTGTTTGVLTAFTGYLAALVVEQLDMSHLSAEHADDIVEVQHLLGVWDWMKMAGYPLSDQDKADRTALEVRHTELAAQVEAAAS